MKNEFSIIKEQKKEGVLYLFVDTNKAILRGMKWTELGDWGKRKFKNLLRMTHRHKTKEYTKIIYV